MTNSINNKPINQRIVALDVLRGFAVLGILVMNIQSFAMPFAAYMNPTAFSDFNGINRLVWALGHIFSDSKFITLFSLLFGAGVAMFIERAQTNHPDGVLSLHYRRTLLLLLFGLLHGYLIWFGDILYLYALCGLWLCFFINLSPVSLVIIGVLLNTIIIAAGVHQGDMFRAMSPEELTDIVTAWQPTSSQMAQEISALTGSLAQIQQVRIAQVEQQHAVASAYCISATGTMMIGIALYKWGILSAQRSDSFYRQMIIVGLVVGLPLIGVGIISNFAHQWDIYYSMGTGKMINYAASFAIVMSYIAIIMLAIKRNWRPNWQHRLGAVGQMALTNYIAQSVIATFIFYGHGLGYYGQLNRSEQLLIVFAIWALQLWYSPLWLARYRFGPLEWLWRSLTYLHPQPMTKV